MYKVCGGIIRCLADRVVLIISFWLTRAGQKHTKGRTLPPGQILPRSDLKDSCLKIESFMGYKTLHL